MCYMAKKIIYYGFTGGLQQKLKVLIDQANVPKDSNQEDPKDK